MLWEWGGVGGYHMHIMCCGVRAAIVCDVQLIGRLSLVVVPCVAAVGAATPLWLMRLHKTGDTWKLINVNVPWLRLFISVKPNRAFDNRLEPEYSRNNEHAIESGGRKKGTGRFKEEWETIILIRCPRRVSFVLYITWVKWMFDGEVYCVCHYFYPRKDMGASRRVLGADASLLRKYLHSPVSLQPRRTLTCTVSEAGSLKVWGQYTHGRF